MDGAITSRISTNVVNKSKEIGSFEQIIHQFEEMKRSGLLTPQVARANVVCCALLENSHEIKARYIGMIKKQQHQRYKLVFII